MRRSMMACHDQERINQFLTLTRIGFLGFSNEAYVVPLNYIWYEGTLYFHCANEGRKIELINEHPSICFTVCEEYGTLVDPQPANTDTSFFSVMIFGEAKEVNNLKEATKALQVMLEKYVPGYYPTPLAEKYVERYRSSLGSPVVLYKVSPTKLTAKENAQNEEKAYYHGRTQGQDLKKSR
ncbi:pyridoxamine 5'-phosphate oxidase family protein [Halalkalibacter akibai]|uniref:Pyridoxamine 5'-phosphate oxidase n=1 Tax=Halalkalibacter akibai (strain ATCC 43226 / DSM 21942 / CIP 109018 / JCM 9157 / 1139) TaxID=1236973 RepID=W4QRU7_HALA3|nr:pyridoxamine 5'-phosphate oxidase family protein [Halalkalibacter akibai]GAE34821.1 pyridoxamine 5'-phosphate oxidase [Halalkalibacter akibai JCM 9157]